MCIRDRQYAGNELWMTILNNRYQFIKSDGSPLTAKSYDMLYTFSEGLAGYQEGYFWGYMNQNGKQITPPRFGLAWDFKEGLARAPFREGIGFIDTKGELVLRPDWVDARDFSEGLAGVQIY